MHYFIKLGTALCALALFGSSPVAWAAPVCPSQPISFAFFESGLLYSESSHDGIDKAVMKELAHRSKCKFDFSFKPRARIWLEMERGVLMMTGSAIRSPQRDAYAWGVNYFGLRAEVMIRGGDGSTPKTREEFLNDETLKMGVARTFMHGPAMDQFIDELRRRNRVVDVPPGSMYEMLMRNRYAAMPFYPLDQVYRDKHDAGQFSVAADWFPTDKSVPRALLFSKKYFTQAQVQEWRALVQQMRDDGTLKKIFTRYAGKETAEKLMQYTPDPQ